MKIFLVKARYERKLKLNKLYYFIKWCNKNELVKVGLIYSVQYEKLVNQVEKFLNRYGLKVTSKNQIVGCKCIAKNANVFLYIGDGLFHPLSFIKVQIDKAILKLKNFELKKIKEQIKPLWIFNLTQCQKLEEEEIERQIKDLKTRFFNWVKAKTYGVLISIKPGQVKIKEAIKIKKLIEKKIKNQEVEKQAFLFLANEIKPEEFINFKIDFWINTACPQFSVEGYKNMCNLNEFFIFQKLIKVYKE